MASGTDPENDEWAVTERLGRTFRVRADTRFGKPLIRGMRMTPSDVIGYLASGMSTEEILDEFPYLTRDDVIACLEFATHAVRREEAIMKRAAAWYDSRSGPNAITGPLGQDAEMTPPPALAEGTKEAEDQEPAEPARPAAAGAAA